MHELAGLTFSGLSEQTCSTSHKEPVTDVSLGRFHTFITQVTADNIIIWVTRLSTVDWVYSKTLILLATLRTQNKPRESMLCIFGSRTFCPSVSHSSTDSEIISLDAGLRLDGIPALDLWDVVIEVLRSSNSTKPTHQSSSRKLFAELQIQTKTKGNRDVDQWSHVDYVKLQNLFDITQRLILDHQTEILNVSPIDWTAPSWTRSTLTHDQVITWTKAAVRQSMQKQITWRRKEVVRNSQLHT